MPERYRTFEQDHPWIVYTYGLTHDGWWPLRTSTRVLGRARIGMECAVCGERTVLTIRMPRFGVVPEPEGGKHPERLRFLLAHVHATRPHPAAWARPLLNWEAHPGGTDLDLLAMRLEADLREALDAPAPSKGTRS